MCSQFSTDRLQILCQPSRLDRAIMASWTETWTDKVSTHICIFYKFFEFLRICLSLPFMPNLLSNIKILLLLPNILIRSEVWRGNWYHHKDKFKSNWAFYFLVNIGPNSTSSKWLNIYGYSGSEDVVWLESSALLSCQNSIKSSLLSQFFSSLQASYLALLVGRGSPACPGLELNIEMISPSLGSGPRQDRAGARFLQPSSGPVFVSESPLV